MEGDQNNTCFDEIKLYQSVMKTMMSKVKSSDTPNDLRNKFQLIETVARSLQELFALGDISNDLDKILPDRKGSHDVPPSKRVAREQGASKRVAREHLATENKMQIYVERPMGKTFVLNVKEGDTIHNVKAMIQDVQHIPQARQTLIFGGTTLKDDCTLSACNIKSGSILHMILGEKEEVIRILITSPEGEHGIHLYVRKWFTIWDVKTMIASVKHIPKQNQKLACNGKQLEDFVSLADCNFDHRFELQLTHSTKVFHPIKIFVDTLGGTRNTFYVHSSFGVYHLKKLIEEETGIPADQQGLICPGVFKMDDSKTLEDYKVKDGSITHLLLILRGS